MSITPESTKTEQSKHSDMITAFEAQASAGKKIHFPEVLINLEPGEHYAGVILGRDGEANHHLILLAGAVEKVTFDEAVAWAKGQGGELPSRIEQSILFANLKGEFEESWYWSGEPHEEAGWAWCQRFSYGRQTTSRKDHELRARAVRRLVIE